MTDTSPAPANDRLRTWHPGWTGVALGTGGAALASLLDPLPGTDVDVIVGAVLTLLAALALLLLVPLALRAARHRDAAHADLANPGLGALYGTAPAAAMLVAIAVAQLAMLELLPTWVAWVSLALLVVGVLSALAVGVAFFARVVAHEQVPVPAMTGAWFIPIVALALVPSALARIVVLLPATMSGTTAAAAVAAWGAGFVLFLLLAPVVAWRLITGPAPAAHAAPSWWIWLAPAGAGGLGLIATSRLLAAGVEDPGAQVILLGGKVGATMLWGFAVWWAVFAGRVLRSTSRAHGGLPFHLGSWGFAFPTAAVTALTLELGRLWGSAPLSVAGALGWVATLGIWAVLAWQTVRGVRDGSVFAR